MKISWFQNYICMIMVSFCCEIKRIYKISLQEGCKTDSIIYKRSMGHIAHLNNRSRVHEFLINIFY